LYFITSFAYIIANFARYSMFAQIFIEYSLDSNTLQHVVPTTKYKDIFLLPN